MITFAAMLVPYFKTFESCDYGNKRIDLLFQIRNVIKFSSPFAACFLCFKKKLYPAKFYLPLVNDISFSYDFCSLIPEKLFV